MTDEKTSGPPAAKKRPVVDARPVLDKLARFHPQLFGAHFLPLKLGIFEELMAAHPGDFTKEELKAFGVRGGPLTSWADWRYRQRHGRMRKRPT